MRALHAHRKIESMHLQMYFTLKNRLLGECVGLPGPAGPPGTDGFPGAPGADGAAGNRFSKKKSAISSKKQTIVAGTPAQDVEPIVAGTRKAGEGGGQNGGNQGGNQGGN